MLAGCLLVKTAKYTVSDVNTSVEHSLMAARLFTCIFACDVMHPTRLCDFATYVPSQVWPGVDLFGDRYRCNSHAMLEALEFDASELVAAGYALESLPVISLYEHIAHDLTKSASHTVHARILRCKVHHRIFYH